MPIKKFYLLLSVGSIALASSAAAQGIQDGPAQAVKNGAGDSRSTRASAQAPEKESFSTGVAKGRDRLDSATSTSALKAAEIEKAGARSLGEVLRNIPGIRAEYAGGEGVASFSIRGLPLAGTGSKYMQLQEDGLPVLEFGDIQSFSPDAFMRFDRNVAQVEAIRGGSSSTFASNSPGGVINLLSKTGDVEGGAVQGTLGLNYGEHRIDADYGHKVSDTLRFHVGGFYRQGEGPRDAGYDAYKGGQIKLNITRTFANGYIRLFGKYLNDRAPVYQPVPLMVSGSNASPVFTSVPNFDAKSGSQLSPDIRDMLHLDRNNRVKLSDLRDGIHSIVKSVGFESQFDFGDWTVSDKFRFAAISGSQTVDYPAAIMPAGMAAIAFGGPGATLSYATGPKTGQAITNPTTLNGNGLLGYSLLIDSRAKKLDNVTNDLRVSRVWAIGKGELTTTAGFYKSSQDYFSDLSIGTILSDVRGDGKAALVNVTSAGGTPLTQDGYLAYSFPAPDTHLRADVSYSIDAPYGSFNYHIGKLAIGGSLRYDMGHVNGSLFSAALGGGRVGAIPYDINGDGKISLPEQQTGILPLGSPGKVDYNYHYLSYSVGANFRIAEPLAVFGRYSRGARASADGILFTPALNWVAGKLVDPAAAFGVVKQKEIGMKFRQSGVTINITGFSATTGERNVQVAYNSAGTPFLDNIVRSYNAKGIEVEAGIRRGLFALAAGGTYTSAKIASDVTHPDVVGHTPRHQASFIFQAMPQIETKYVTFGANFIGTTSSYTQDVNQLKLPAYTLVNAFVQVRPIEKVQLMLNVNNVFDKLALAEVLQGAIPAGGIVLGRTYNGRTISATARYSF
jgi:outer membrane receptor protein involved in Fe transport